MRAVYLTGAGGFFRWEGIFMDVREILDKIDELLHQCRLDEAEEYMNGCLEQAHSEGRTDIEITLYNELAGFYRDCGKFESSLDCCRRSEELLDIIGEGDSPRRCAALLNCANACRASGKLNEAYGYYDKIWGMLGKLPDEEGLLSSYYNNLACFIRNRDGGMMLRTVLKRRLKLRSGLPRVR